MPNSERINALKGRFIHLPLSTEQTFNQLNGDKNNNLLDVEDYVYCYGRPRKDKTVWRHLVDRIKVYNALKWLCENNPNYKDITLPDQPEDILPDLFGNDETDEYGQLTCNICNHQGFNSHEDYFSHQKCCEEKVFGQLDGNFKNNESEYDSNANLDKLDCNSFINISDDDQEQCLHSNSPVSRCNYSTHPEIKHPAKQSKHKNILSEIEDRDLGNHVNERNLNKTVDIEIINKKGDNSCHTESNKHGNEICIEKPDVKKEKSDENQTSKPWIELMTRKELNEQFGHLVMKGINRDVDDAKELFKMINVDSKLVETHAANLDCEAFPEVFPFGMGGRTADRAEKIDDAFFEKAHLLTSDSYAPTNQEHIFFMAQQREIRDLKAGIFNVLHSKSNAILTKGNLTSAAKAKDPELLKKVSNVLRKVPSQKEFWNDVKTKAEQMVSEYGPATFWATFSPGDYDDVDLHQYLKEMNSDLGGFENISNVNLISRDPILAFFICKLSLTVF